MHQVDSLCQQYLVVVLMSQLWLLITSRDLMDVLPLLLSRAAQRLRVMVMW
jgi:hypothetical protein